MQLSHRNVSPLPSSRGQVRHVWVFKNRRDVPKVDIVLFDVGPSLLLVPLKLHLPVLSGPVVDLASVFHYTYYRAYVRAFRTARFAREQTPQNRRKESMSYEQAVEELFETLQHIQHRDGSEGPSLSAKKEVYEEYGPYFQPEEVKDIKEHEIVSFLKQENNRHWSGLIRAKNKVTKDMEALRAGLSVLVDETEPLAPRFTEAMERVHGMGTAIATAILHVAYPEKYGVWNGKSKGGMKRLGLWPEFAYGAPIGEKYEKVNGILLNLAEELDTDLWTLDYLWHWHQVFKEEEEKETVSEDTESRTQRFGLEQHLQDFLRDNWAETETLGAEWVLFEDETGTDAGYEYQTAIGRIDLLAEHKEEDRWLVIELKRGQTSDETVGQVLRYIGAVREELAGEDDDIEGLIIARDVDDKIRYALREVPAVSFRRYEVEFHLRPDGSTG